jgi:hypothetical protein
MPVRNTVYLQCHYVLGRNICYLQLKKKVISNITMPYKLIPLHEKCVCMGNGEKMSFSLKSQRYDIVFLQK